VINLEETDTNTNTNTNTNTSISLPTVTHLSRDLANSSKLLSRQEVRYLVDTYYQIQDDRIRMKAQVRTLGEAAEPNSLQVWLGEQYETLEKQIRRALDKYTDSRQVGLWLKSICGIGPVISAGLLAHIDITRAPTAGHIWSYAGLSPNKPWLKGQKRPWNADLKRLCYLIGESFVKVQSNEHDFYGKYFKECKESEIELNNSGDYAKLAEKALTEKKYDKTTDAYKAYISGKLPPAHIHARARRKAVKLFLSHLFEVWYYCEYGKIAPDPYVIAVLGHVHRIPPPNSHVIDGLATLEATRGPVVLKRGI
jgi:hypothetical protein